MDSYVEHHTVYVANDVLRVGILASQGADIHSFVDVESGVDLLFRTPWGLRPRGSLATGASDQPTSKESWLHRYPGGWQMLLPNAGEERVVDGVFRGYHGEASTVPWSVADRTPTSARLSTRLSSLPLSVERQVSVVGHELLVEDWVTNESDSPYHVPWVAHPGFGAPFVDEYTLVRTGARRFIADAQAPGTDLAPDVVSEGDDERLRRMPAQQSGVNRFGVLTGFGSNPWFELHSPTVGFGVRMEWSARTHPHAWFWQECGGTAGYPWFGRAYVVGIEPANVLPGTGVVDGRQRGEAPVLGARSSWHAVFSLRRIELDDEALTDRTAETVEGSR